jgi:hypothetical protein
MFLIKYCESEAIMIQMLKHFFTLNLLIISFAIAVESPNNMKIRPHTTGEIVPVAEAEQIARAIAGSAWGNLFDQNMTPYYSYKDELVAYRFNWAVDKAMPPHSELLDELASRAATGDFKGQWGDGEFATVLMSARRDMAPLLERMNALAPEFGMADRRQRLADRVLGPNGQWGKAWFFSFAEIWYEYTLSDRTIYVNPFPATAVKTATEFNSYRADQQSFFCAISDYSSRWMEYANDPPDVNRTDTFIPDREYMPFTKWSYGCSPASGSMLYAWYDFKSLIYINKLSRFVDYHKTRWDDIQEEWDYHVPNLGHELKLAMDTDGSGSTYIFDVDDGMIEVASDNGYEADSEVLYYHFEEYLFNYLQDEIDDNIPLLSGIDGHTMVGVGYNTATDEYINHDPNYGSLNYRGMSSLDHLIPVHITSADTRSAVNLVTPQGGQGWQANGVGETFHTGDYVSIIWDGDFEAGTLAGLFYSTDGGGDDNWSAINSTLVSNTGLFHWLVPWGINSTSCRVRVYVYDADGTTLLGSDGSYGDFTITPGPGVRIMYDGQQRITDSNPDYLSFQNTQAAYAVIGVRSDFSEGIWSLELYDDDSFNNLLIDSDGGFQVNYVVINDAQLEIPTRGVRVLNNADDTQTEIEFESGGEILDIGENGPFNWAPDDLVEIWNIWLEEGRHKFDLHDVVGAVDLDFSLYHLPDPPYLASRSGYFQGANGGSTGYGTDESFVCTVYNSGWYGVCVQSRTAHAANFKIRVSDPGTWSGEISTDWYNPYNWIGWIIPEANTDVSIPGGCDFYPVCVTETTCYNLLIEQQASLTIQDDFLVGMHLTSHGDLLVENSYAELEITGNAYFRPVSNLYCDTNTKIRSFGSWTIDSGAEVEFNLSTLEFHGSEASFINNHDYRTEFHDLVNDKNPSTSLYLSNSSISEMLISGDLILRENTSFVGLSEQNLRLADDIVQETGASFQFEAGRVIINGTYAELTGGPNDYFNLLSISDAHLVVHEFITVNQNLQTFSGSELELDGAVLRLHRNWINSGGTGVVTGAGGTVVLQGEEDQNLVGEFNLPVLQINNPTGSLICENGDLIDCATLEFQQGNLLMNGGQVIARDLASNSVVGNYQINGGELNLQQDSLQTIGLDANFDISDGLVTLQGGGTQSSSWPFSQDASLTMSGGTLDIVDAGIYFQDSAFELDLDISGGLIRTAGSINGNRLVNLDAGMLEVYGTDNVQLGQAPGSSFFNLMLKKLYYSRGQETLTENRRQLSARYGEQGREARDMAVELVSELNVVNDLIIDVGTLSINGQHLTVGHDLDIQSRLKMRSDGRIDVNNDVIWRQYSWALIDSGEFHLQNGCWMFEDDANAMLSGSNTVVFDGAHSSGTIIAQSSTAAFQNLCSEQIYRDTIISGESTQAILVNGSLCIADGNTLQVGSNDLQVAAAISIPEYSEIRIGVAGILRGNDLAINGSLSLNSGSLELSGELGVGSLGELTMNTGSIKANNVRTRGDFNVNGGLVESLTDLTIEAGTLALGAASSLDVGADLFIAPGAALRCEADAAGISIWLGGDWGNMNSVNDATQGFHPGLSALRFDGSVDQQFSSAATEELLYHLVIEKSAGEFLANSPFLLTGNYAQYEGVVGVSTSGLVHSFKGDLMIGDNATWLDSTCVIQFIGSNEQEIDLFEPQCFNAIEINKANANRDVQPASELINESRVTRTSRLVLSRDTEIRNCVMNISSGLLDLDSHTLSFVGSDSEFRTNPGSTVIVGEDAELLFHDGMQVSVGGRLEVLGSAGHEARIANQRFGHFAMNISGEISASYAIFEDLAVSGLVIDEGAYIDTMNSFDYCTFRRGDTGGTLLTINNNPRGLVINHATFDDSPQSDYNVAVTEDVMFQHTIDMLNTHGDFAGAGFENDPYSAIEWDTVMDIQMVDFEWSEVVAFAGDSLWAIVELENTGAVGCGFFEVGLYEDQHDAPVFGDLPDHVIQVYSIPAGMAVSCSTIVSSVSEGHWRSWALADWDQNQDEFDESNNHSGFDQLAWVSIPPVNDLQINFDSDRNEISLEWSYPIWTTSFYIYRSSDPDFIPDPETLRGQTHRFSFSESLTGDCWFYRVRAARE